MFIYVYFCLLFFSYWVCWVRGNFSGGPGHIFSVCVTPLCGVPGRYNLPGTFLERMAGLYRFFLFLWLCCSGYGTVEIVRGVVRISSCFSQFAVSSLGGWRSVVGFLCYINRFSLVDLWYFLAVSYFVSC